jgi:hypothetical protein
MAKNEDPRKSQNQGLLFAPTALFLKKYWILPLLIQMKEYRMFQSDP